MSRTGHRTAGRQVARHPAGQLRRAVRRLEHDLLVGVDRATDLLLSPLAVDFHGWTFGDQRNETWM